MQTPELLLTKLNQALRELRGAARMLDDSTLDAKLLPVVRRLTLAEVMHKRWLIAVGGTQGAGKTTLVRTLYDLQDNDPWLPANEGRGETLPVLIEEHADHDTPRGYAIVLRPENQESTHFVMDEVPLLSEQFRDACRGRLADVLLPVLKVPRRHFRHDGQALMLLPGYEKRTTDNEVWQDLMRQALVGAAGCVIVTDSTRLASQSQQDVVRDMLASELRTVRPLIVVAKTEAFGNDEKKLEEVRQTAISAFELTGDDAGRRVFCAGVDAPGANGGYVQRWLPALSDALCDMSLSGTASRQVQLAKLEQTLTVELADVVKELHTQSRLYFRQSKGEDDGHESVKDLLEAFDDACDSLRVEHQKMVKTLMGEHYKHAWVDMQDRLQRDHEGMWNKIVGTFDTVTESQRKIENDVLEAWHAPGTLLERYTAGLGTVSMRVAGPRLPQGALALSSAPLQRLGYVDDKNNPVQAPFTDEKVQSAVYALMRSRAGEVESRHTQPELENAAALLPAMALEFTRIASALPQLVHVNEATLQKMPEGDLNASMGNMQKQFSTFSQASSGILKGIAAVMAVDVASDGHADIIDAVMKSVGIGSAATASTGAGTAAATAGLTVGGAIAGAIAIGYLAHSAMQEVRRHDGQVRALANSMLQHTRDYHELHFEDRFDDLMKTVRSHLKMGLRRRHGLDQRVMHQDRLQKAIADVKTLQHNLLSQLAQSGQTLALFNTAQA